MDDISHYTHDTIICDAQISLLLNEVTGRVQ
jgi:hypothetical protein